MIERCEYAKLEETPIRPPGKGYKKYWMELKSH